MSGGKIVPLPEEEGGLFSVFFFDGCASSVKGGGLSLLLGRGAVSIQPSLYRPCRLLSPQLTPA